MKIGVIPTLRKSVSTYTCLFKPTLKKKKKKTNPKTLTVRFSTKKNL